MDIVFFGNEKLATGIDTPEPIIQNAVEKAGFNIEQIITGPLTDLQPHKAQLAVLAAYGRIIPQRVLDEFPLGIINIHPSLLPQYRGPTPIEQAILAGLPKTGVSIMQLSAGMDEGPIYKQKTYHLTGNETKSELTQALQLLGAELLIEVIEPISKGIMKPRQQPHPDRATYCQKIKKEDGMLDWQKPAITLAREIRAYAGWPQSRTTLAGKDIVVLSAEASDMVLQPGEISIQGKGIFVGCKEGSLKLLTLKPAGKKAMSAEAFLAGYKQLLVV